MFFHKIAKVPESEFLTEGRKLSCVYRNGAGQAVEVHRLDDATKALLINDAEFCQHLRYEF